MQKKSQKYGMLPKIDITHIHIKEIHKKEMEHMDVKADMYSVLYTCM